MNIKIPKSDCNSDSTNYVNTDEYCDCKVNYISEGNSKKYFRKLFRKQRESTRYKNENVEMGNVSAVSNDWWSPMEEQGRYQSDSKLKKKDGHLTTKACVNNIKIKRIPSLKKACDDHDKHFEYK